MVGIAEKAAQKHAQRAVFMQNKRGEGIGKGNFEIVGELPNPLNPPSGCAFHKRCPYATELCSTDEPVLRLLDNRQVACHHAEQFLQS